MKKISSSLLIAGLCALLVACSGGESSSPPLPSSDPEASVSEREQPVADETPQPKDEAPAEVPEASAGILREMHALGPEGISIANDSVEFAGGSLVATADAELIELVGEVLLREWRPTEAPGPGYSEFVKIRAAGAGIWSVQMTRAEDSERCYLWLADVYEGEFAWYEADSDTFDLLHRAVESRTSMIEAPVEEFLGPVQIVVAHYRSGNYDAEEYAAIYEKPPQGAVIPAVNSEEDFTVVPGRDLAPYHVIFPIEGVRYNMVLAMIQVYPPADQPQVPSWRVMTVTFEPRGA